METWDALRARRNVRRFAAKPVPAEALERILDAGRRAPSAKNWQPWDFVVVTDPSQLSELARVWRGAAYVAHAPAVVALVAPEPRDERESQLIQFDLGQATMTMMVAATDLGLGTGHASVADQDLARSVLGFPRGRFCAYLLAIGYPAEGDLRPLRRLNRRPLEEVVHYGRW
ncbi:MAG TPA: nitroreductase family protein [Micromonosporaceae bacterium]|nr:nitroreductase family protein [Micromonosporaceae bacterium]